MDQKPSTPIPLFASSLEKIDVMLVQYLLNKAFETSLYAQAKPVAAMKVDGMYGPVTAAHIMAFQRQDSAVNPDASVLADGRVDKAVSASGICGAISHRVYTIAGLNKMFHDKFPALFSNPAFATDMPSELKATMSAIAISQQFGVAA